jgi:opacity protein-like surface antigen
MRWREVVTVVGALLLILTVAPAQAEWFADLYAGGAFTKSNDIDNKNFLVVDLTLRDVEFDDSFEVGGRVGYWSESVPFVGAGLDVFHFRPNVSRQNVDAVIFGAPGTFALADVDLRVIGISFDLMLRWPLLKSADFPHGRLQPYASIGPTIFIVEAEDSTNFAPPANATQTDTAVGFKAGAGTTFLFTKNIGLFAEYRFTQANPEFEFRTTGLGRSSAETELNTHHVVVGATFRF